MLAPAFELKSLTAKLLAIYVPMVCLALLVVFALLQVQFYRSERAGLIQDLHRVAALQGAALTKFHVLTDEFMRKCDHGPG